MKFFDAEKSGSLTSNDISWRSNSALTDALSGASLSGGFYDGANGVSTPMAAIEPVILLFLHNEFKHCHQLHNEFECCLTCLESMRHGVLLTSGI